MAGGFALLITGLLVFTQVIFGDALTRLGITQRIQASL